MEIEIAAQIFSGGYSGKSVPYETVEQKLASVLPRLPINKIIMGWAPNKALYEKTADFLAKRNIEFYLWFPVFSETGTLRNMSPLVDFRGNEIGSRSHGEENFAFCCPNNVQNIENIIDIFETEFSSIPFTGVFLDKIRYPSFANDKSGVYTCFCPHCLSLYDSMKFNTRRFISALSSALGRPGETPLAVTKYRGNGKYEFQNQDTADFLSLKQGFITESLKRICRYFREKNKKIAFDVFAPFLSVFTGQDLTRLSTLCDFMKPMMYRITRAPAGLPFETEALLRETNSTTPLPGHDFSITAGFDPAKKPFDLAFTVKELSALASSSACPVYAGVEINRKKNIAEANPGYIKETIKACGRTGIRGLALSWDLLDAPEENILSAMDYS